MLNNKRSQIFIGFLLCIVVVFSVLTVGVMAESKPWDAYSEYIPNNTPVAKRHLRGTWISTVINLDWPSSDTIKIVNNSERIQKSKDELVVLLDKAVEMNQNAVFFQVSPEGDALYKSNIVPWSRYLTGTFGKDPGFDPLAFIIEESRKRNLEVHAWFNPYRVSMDIKEATKTSLDIEKSVYKENPQWIKTSMDRFVVDPGIPETRKWVIGRVMEVVKNYDIDGIHFDDYFYYEKYEGELKDEGTFEKYKGRFSNIGDWRRNNTYLLVKELSKEIRSSKSWVKFGISPAGVWGNKSDGLSSGSNTKSSFTNYNKSFADTKKWVEEELIDYIAPQIYFAFANPRASYGEVANWWSKICKGKNVHLYIGMALYKINDDSDQYFKGQNAVAEFIRQLKFNIAKPEIIGDIMFRAKNFTDSGKAQVVDVMKNDLWAAKTLVPAMPWKGGKVPDVPTYGNLQPISGGIKLTWKDESDSTAYYAIYRFKRGEQTDIASDASAHKLIATVRKNNNGLQEFVDTENNNPDSMVYIVSALDRLHDESSGLAISSSKSKHFADVGEKYSWALEVIDSLYEKGIVKGDEHGMFNPGRNTKRGDFTIMIVKALGFKANFTSNFTDVPKDSYYYEAIGIAKELGIVKGSGDKFNPDGNITREDMMVIVVNAINKAGLRLDMVGEEHLSGYNDKSKISGYARQSVASLTKAGIISGFDGGVKPKNLATRAEIAIIIHKVISDMEYI